MKKIKTILGQIGMEDPMTKLTMIIAVCTALNVFVSIYQGVMSNKSINFNREVFEYTNRPWVSVEHIAVNDSMKIKQGEPIFWVVCKYCNYNMIPANSVIFTNNIKINGKEPEINNVGPTVGASLLFQKSPLFSSWGFVDSGGLVLSGKSKIYIVVHITYKGISNKQYFTEIEYTYNSFSHSFSVVRSSYN